MRNRLKLAASAAALSLWVPVAAHAQNSEDGSSPGAEERTAPAASDGVNDIIVTAQRREESLQKVPVPITALTSDTIERSNVTAVEQLQALSPGLNMSFAISASNPYIRGVGSAQAGSGTESAVTTYVDGVYIGPSLGGIFSFNNIERIEVLRGPQGTLFGRNSTGGALNITTKMPGQTFEGKFGLSYENYQRVTAEAYLSGGITDNLAADFAVYAVNQGKGFGTNLTLGEDIGYRDEVALRTKWAFTPSDAVQLIFSADYDYRNDDAGIYRNIYPGSLGFAGLQPAPDVLDAQSDVPRRVSLTQGGASLKAIIDLGAVSLTSITAYREYLNKSNFDQDSSPTKLFEAQFRHGDQTYQQELLLQGGGDRFDWTTGLFLFRGDVHHQLTGVSSVNAGSNWIQKHELTTRSVAVYGQGTYKLFDTTRLTLGARYTRDRQTMYGDRIALAGNTAPAGTVLIARDGLKYSTGKVTWRAAIDQDFSDTIMGYASYSRGFKNGGLNVNDLNQAAIRPEVLDAFEIGAKADLLGRRLRVNVSAFDYDYQDIQIVASNAGITQTLNAARGKVKGGELEVTAIPSLPVGRLELKGSLALLRARYSSFPNAPYFVPNPATCTPVPQTTGPATGGNRLCTADASGNVMVRSPRTTYSLSALYALPLGDGEISASADYYHTAGFYWTTDNRLRNAPYGLLSATLAYETDSGFTVRLFGKNLLDKEYITWGNTSTLADSAYYGAPRTYGIGIGYKF